MVIVQKSCLILKDFYFSYMYLFFSSLNPSFWRLLIPTVTWLSMCVQPTPRNVSGQGESTMIWMMSAKMSTITHSLKCWEIGPLEITSRFVPIVESVKLHTLCISVSILAAKLKNNKDYTHVYASVCIENIV